MSNKPYIILRNPIDERYKLLENKDGVTAYDMCVIDGKTVKHCLTRAKNWFDIAPGDVEI